MQQKKNQLFFSPSDLITFSESKFASHMERCLINDNKYSKFIDQEDPLLQKLQKKGFEHEKLFLKSLKESGKSIIEIEKTKNEISIKQTKIAMQKGVDVIAQAHLEKDKFGGIADFLIKVQGQSKIGDYHYEIWDTKLSKKMKPYFAIQLSCYAEMLENIQGLLPKKVVIILGDNKINNLKLKDYFGYYKSLKLNFINFHNNWTIDCKPDPFESSSHGRWSEYAQKILEKKRHLSLIANITK